MSLAAKSDYLLTIEPSRFNDWKWTVERNGRILTAGFALTSDEAEHKARVWVAQNQDERRKCYEESLERKQQTKHIVIKGDI